MRIRSGLVIAALALVPLAGRPTEPTVEAGSRDGAPPAGPSRDLITPDGVEWRTVRAIQVAAKEAGRKGVKPDGCRILAHEDDKDLVVVFTNPNPGSMTRGCPSGPCRCFEVLMERSTLRVTRSNYSR